MNPRELHVLLVEGDLDDVALALSIRTRTISSIRSK
jgi:hypothetical protein